MFVFQDDLFHSDGFMNLDLVSGHSKGLGKRVGIYSRDAVNPPISDASLRRAASPRRNLAFLAPYSSEPKSGCIRPRPLGPEWGLPPTQEFSWYLGIETTAAPNHPHLINMFRDPTPMLESLNIMCTSKKLDFPTCFTFSAPFLFAAARLPLWTSLI